MASRQRKAIGDEMGRFIERGMRRLQLRCYQALTSATPVLTGFARAGWSPSAGVPAPGPESPGGGKRVAPGVVEEAARAQAQALFSKHTQASQALAAGYRLSQGPIFIVNNVRYVVYLNQGTSAQAPAMFVEQAIATAVAATQRELR